jgi:hypothetical protein
MAYFKYYFSICLNTEKSHSKNELSHKMQFIIRTMNKYLLNVNQEEHYYDNSVGSKHTLHNTCHLLEVTVEKIESFLSLSLVNWR